MENRDNFYIRRVQNVGTENKCPVCGDSFTANYLAVHDYSGQPLCDLCAWEKAMEVLFANRRIRVEEYGRPSDRRRQIVETKPETEGK